MIEKHKLNLRETDYSGLVRLVVGLLVLMMFGIVNSCNAQRTIVTGKKYLYAWYKFDPNDPFEKEHVDTIIVVAQISNYVEWTYPHLAKTNKRVSSPKKEFLVHIKEIPESQYFKSSFPLVEADPSALYAMDNDSVFFKPCTGKRNYIGKYDKKTNSILLK